MYDDILNKKEHTRTDLTFLYIVNSLGTLREMGIVKGGRFQISESGRSLIEGFKPTKEEMEEVLMQMKIEGIL